MPGWRGRVVLLALGCVLAGVLFGAAAAFAAPESPEVVVEGVSTSGVMFHGVLSPGASEPNSGGSYKFLYRASKTLCTGGSETSPGLSLGQPHEEVFEPVSSLTPGTDYMVCLSVTNLASETTVSAPVAFKTALTPEAPKTTSPAAHITATTATFEGVLNPKAATVEKDGWYFAYATTSQGPSCTEGSATAVEPEEEVKAKHEEVALTGLQPSTEYTFCMVATNEIGEATVGNAVKLKTLAAAPTVESEGTQGVSASTATLEAIVNPNNQKTTAHLQYSTSSVVNGSGALTTPTVLASSSLEGYGGQGVANGSLTGLAAGSTFYYQAVATNATGTTYGAVQSFTTVPTPATTAVGAITATTATFNGTLTPLNATVESEYSFDYHAGTAPGTECTGESATGSESAGTGSGTKTVSTEATGLSPNTSYTVCLVSSNQFGSEQASPVTFTTPAAVPAIESESSSNIAATEARLEGALNPGNSPTSWHFEYGTTAGVYEHATPTEQAPAKLTSTTVSAVITGLTPSTTYHYRLVASNALPGSTVYGPDQTFTTTAAAPGNGSTPGTCPNESRREEQSFGTQLPDCRAYEMVSPANTNGQDATLRQYAGEARASVSNTEPAVTYASLGAFSEGDGAREESQLLSRKTPAGWTTQLITPLKAEDGKGLSNLAFAPGAFTPELTEGLTTSTSALAPGAEEITGEGVGYAENLYVADFASSTYKFVAPIPYVQEVYGATPDLRRLVFTPLKAKFLAEEWKEGKDVPVTVTNTPGEEMPASVGAQAPEQAGIQTKNTYRAVSSDGERVFFTSPAKVEDGIGQLYVRTNVAAPEGQSPLAQPEAHGTGTLTEGSKTVRSLVTTGPQPFVVGQRISGNGILPGTTITEAVAGELKLSAPAAASGADVALAGGGGCTVAADACTIEVSASQRYRKSNLAGPQLARYWGASADGSRVFFTSKAELTEDAYTGSSTEQELVVAHEREEGTYTLSFEGQKTGALPYNATAKEVQEALEGLSSIGSGNVTVAAGSKTSGLLITFTGSPAASQPPLLVAESAPEAGLVLSVALAHPAANLYEYDLETSRLSDLTGETADDTGEGAAVQGVSQISEDGSYVYFVADGALAPGATEGEANLYVVHEGGAPVFIATLPANDSPDWSNEKHFPEQVPGPETNTAALAPSGSWFAFLANRALPTAESPEGYDDEQAAAGDCDGEVFHGQNESEAGFCTEVYLYDAVAGRLACASCHPGARPLGPSTLNTSAEPTAESRPRELLENGTLFFDSKDALVPGAASQHENVYEYEDGDIRAISDVAGGYGSWFLDATANGENVFFASADRLLPEDPGGNTVVWDARVNGGVPVAKPAARCASVEACEPPPAAAPLAASSGTAAFSGPGNIVPSLAAPLAPVAKKPVVLTRAEKLAAALKACHRDRSRKQRAACEKTARKRYGVKKKAKHASIDRRAGR